MILYLSVIFMAMVIISILNIFINPLTTVYGWWWVVLATIISVIVEIAIDGLVAFIIHSFPEKYFSPSNKFYDVSRGERKFYEKLKIKSWKDKVWELGALGGFRKNKIADPNSCEYLNKFLVESNKGFLLHLVICFVGFAVIFILPLEWAWVIGFPVAIVNVFLNLLSMMVLRYNTPKLKTAYERARRLSERANNKDK